MTDSSGSQMIDRFLSDGFVKIENAFDRKIGLRCAAELWDQIAPSADDPASWTESLIWVPGMSTPPFTEIANTDVLVSAYDALVGPGRWRPRLGMGTFPLRFPSTEPPEAAGWHVEASFAGDDGGPRVSLRSRGRALLMLFLLSDVGEDDAPTLIRVGSHLKVPPFLVEAGPHGRDWMDVCTDVVPATEDCPVVSATGCIGDVYLCHPFLVHSAQAHHGRAPRFMAQPPLESIGELDLDADQLTPVAECVHRGLSAPGRRSDCGRP
ncbi:phytanoyl-CoA dioxygenase [Gordonia jinghuaiqii]|uniref:Phytanoyl-CoA dioxygenase n=1 Tax=Gordonia jinghuaiqii TaxID=2758710 RepID=A0A7D7LP75_9ACTN|nr:phytanoyl-CoA dioxygenase [Gordonia jinghuaiqii]MCR5976679.1 phytanoyl-CoA dioxygenase [Gordonia jinghuaiqii]QMS99859.1 phytanoyl-CoA dioxygenase [Gordonia jinghuaiqii]